MIFQRACIVFAFPLLVSIGLQPARHFINIRTWNMNSGQPTGGLDIVQLVCSDGDELNHYLDDQYQGLAWQQALLPRMPKGGCGHFCSWLRSLLLLLFITAALKNNKFAQQSKQVLIYIYAQWPLPTSRCSMQKWTPLQCVDLYLDHFWPLHSQDISKINKQWKSLAHIHILIIQVLTISDLSPTTVPPMICSPSLVFWLIIRSLWWIIRLRLNTEAVFAHTPLASLLLSNR